MGFIDLLLPSAVAGVGAVVWWGVQRMVGRMDSLETALTEGFEGLTEKHHDLDKRLAVIEARHLSEFE